MSNVNRLLILITGFLPGFLAWLMWLQAVCQLLWLEVNSATAPTTMTASGTLC